jgi:hypothetical protein
MQWQWILLLALLVFFGWEADRRSKEIRGILDTLNLTLSNLYGLAEQKYERDQQLLSAVASRKVLNEGVLWDYLGEIQNSLNAIKDELASKRG